MAEMVPVTSSNLSSVGWSEEEGLVVEFESGSQYRYPDAPKSAYEGILGAPSAGGYFARFIRDTYSYEMV
jgi:KTSC domain